MERRAIAGFPRNQGGRYDRAFMAKIFDLPMQPIAARAGFVTAESLAARLANVDKLAHVIGAVRKIAKTAHLPTGRHIGNCN